MPRARLLAGLLLASLSVFLMSAKCIENDTVRRGSNNDWTIFGEIHNETDIQGVEILLRGTIFDDDGNAVGVAQARTCPGELSPNSIAVYGIRFNESQTVPQPARHQVNVLSGRAQGEPLPELEAALSDVSVVEVNGTDLRYRFTYVADEAYEGGVHGCIAWYDAAGEVVAVSTLLVKGSAAEPGVAVDFDAEHPDYRQEFGEIAAVRFWVYVDDPDVSVNASRFQAIMTDKVPIQR